MRFALLYLALAGGLVAQEIPHGTVTHHTWTSRIFPGTTRDYWVYVPAQYNAAKPACTMVFQDGGGYAKADGAWRIPAAFDTLIHRGGMPVTIGVFVNPGVLPAAGPNQRVRLNRSYEYDSLGGRYARFLLEEILPEVAKKYSLSTNPDDRAIAGSSSGAIAAFTAAWNRPDAFHRVLSFIGSYTNLRGGDVYPNLIRKMEPLPLRVFLQTGTKDMDNFGGSWYLANQTMAAALKYAGYECEFAVGNEGHNAKHGAAILEDALRWLWKDHPKPVLPAKTSPGTLHLIREFLDPASDWEEVSRGHRFTEGPAVDRGGNVFFSGIPANRVFKLGADGKASVFREDSGGANGTMFGPDGRLYAAQNGRKRIVAWSADGTESVIAEGLESNDLAVTSQGAVYATDPAGRRVWYIDPKGAKCVVYEAKAGSGIRFPNGIRLSPDEALVLVADTASRWVWSFQRQPDGSLAHGEAFYRLEIPDDVESGPLRAGADGMTLDSEGHLYAATKLGIQIGDQAGRTVGIIRTPSAADVSNVVFGGPDLDWLYATAGDKVWRRHLRRHGVFPWQPTMPSAPRL